MLGIIIGIILMIGFGYQVFLESKNMVGNDVLSFSRFFAPVLSIVLSFTLLFFSKLAMEGVLVCIGATIIFVWLIVVLHEFTINTEKANFSLLRVAVLWAMPISGLSLLVLGHQKEKKKE